MLTKCCHQKWQKFFSWNSEYPLKIDKLITSIIIDGKHERIVGNNQDVFVSFYIRNFQATVGRFTQVQMKK